MKWCIAQTNTSVSGEAAATLWCFATLTAWFRWNMTRSSTSSWEHWSNYSIVLDPFSIWIHMLSCSSCKPPRKILQLSWWMCVERRLVSERGQNLFISTGRDWSNRQISVAMPLTLLWRCCSSNLILFCLYKSKTISARVYVADEFLKVDHKLSTKSWNVFNIYFFIGSCPT